MYKAVQSSRLYEQIVQQIEESIQSGELTAGSQLPAERDLAKQFGVSRTAVREAIKALQEKGLVDAFPGRGTFVTNGAPNAMRRSLDRIDSSICWTICSYSLADWTALYNGRSPDFLPPNDRASSHY